MLRVPAPLVASTSTIYIAEVFLRACEPSTEMFEAYRLIEARLTAQGWTLTAVGSNGGMTITASKEGKSVTVHCCSCLAAWQAIEREINRAAH